MAEKLPDWQTDVALLRAFAQVRLIVADLDGSLVHASAHVVYSSLTNLRRSLNHHKSRVGFTLATGRAWNGAKDLVESLSIPRGTPLILYNGALTLECGTSGILDRHCINVNAVDRIRAICSSHAATVYFYDFADPVSASFQREPAERVVADGPAVAPLDFNGLRVQEGSWSTDTLVNCTAILIDIGILGDSVFHLRDSLSNVNEVTCTHSGARYIEIRPAGANKGAALRVVAEHLDLDAQHILTLGDNDNDAEMLSFAGIGVAVKGASVAAMSASNYVCNHGPAEGAVEILRLIKHAKRFYAPSRAQVRTPA
jgi:Cof subfamily protein (haloacid dehalogenase superfamily)